MIPPSVTFLNGLTGAPPPPRGGQDPSLAGHRPAAPRRPEPPSGRRRIAWPTQHPLPQGPVADLTDEPAGRLRAQVGPELERIRRDPRVVGGFHSDTR